MVKFGVLRQVSDADVPPELHLSVLPFARLGAGDDFEQCGFPAAVFGNEGHLLPFVHLQANVLEEYFFTVAFGDVFECEIVHERVIE